MDVTRMPESAVTGGPSRQELLRIYEQTNNIAVVGASADERRPLKSFPSISSRRDIASSPSTPRVRRSSVSACTPL
jgi:predicted CoA-binding protein